MVGSRALWADSDEPAIEVVLSNQPDWAGRPAMQPSSTIAPLRMEFGKNPAAGERRTRVPPPTLAQRDHHEGIDRHGEHQQAEVGDRVLVEADRLGGRAFG